MSGNSLCRLLEPHEPNSAYEKVRNRVDRSVMETAPEGY